MRHVPTIFLMTFMFVSLGAGLYGLAQHIIKASFGPTVATRGR